MICDLPLQILLKQGVDINSTEEKTGDTPLHIAAAAGVSFIASILLEEGNLVCSKAQ